MSENAFADLIPKDETEGNAFADLIPKKQAAKGNVTPKKAIPAREKVLARDILKSSQSYSEPMVPSGPTLEQQLNQGRVAPRSTPATVVQGQADYAQGGQVASQKFRQEATHPKSKEIRASANQTTREIQETLGRIMGGDLPGPLKVPGNVLSAGLGGLVGGPMNFLADLDTALDPSEPTGTRIGGGANALRDAALTGLGAGVGNELVKGATKAVVAKPARAIASRAPEAVSKVIKKTGAVGRKIGEYLPDDAKAYVEGQGAKPTPKTPIVNPKAETTFTPKDNAFAELIPAKPTKLHKTTETPISEPSVPKKAVAEEPIPKAVEPVAIPPNPARKGAEGEKYASSNAASQDLRDRAKVGELPKTPKNLAVETQDYDRAIHYSRLQKIEEDVTKGGKKAPTFTEEENRLTDKLVADQGAELDDLIAKRDDALTKGKDVSGYNARLASLEKEIDTTTAATRYVGTSQSRALSSRNQAIYDDYTSAGLYRQHSLAKGGTPLTAQEKAKSYELSQKIVTSQRELDRLVNQKMGRQAQESVTALASEGKQLPRSTPEAILARRTAAVERIKTGLKSAGRELLIPKELGSGPGQSIVRSASELKAIAPDILELAKTYIEEGALKLEDVVKGIRGQIPELSDGDIHKIIAGEYEKDPVKRTKTTLGQITAEARQQPDVLTAKGIRKQVPRQEAYLKRKEVADFKVGESAKLRAERERILTAKKESRRLEVQSRQQTRKEIAGAFREDARAKKEAFDNSPAGELERLDKRTQRLQEKIDTKTFPTKKQRPTFEDQQIERAKIKLEATKVEADEIRDALKSQREWDELTPQQQKLRKVSDALFQAPKALKASSDLSFPLNQGAFYAITHPGTSAKAAWKGVQALVNRNPEEFARQALAEVRANPKFELARGSGLKIQTQHLTEGGEMLTSNLLGRKIGPGTLDFNPVSASGRAYVANANKLRMDMFSNIVDSMEKPWMRRFGAKPLSKEDYRAIAEYVNTATGEGTGVVASPLKNLNQKAPVFFAPGYAVSRWKLAMGTPAFNAAIRRNPALAAYILKDYLTFAGVVAGSLYAAKSAGAKVEFDPRSSKFGKMQWGKADVDPFGGILSPLRLAVQMKWGTKDAKGQTHDPNSATTLGYYLRGKAAPSVSLGLNILDKKAFGESYDPKKKEGLKNIAKDLFLPISPGSIGDMAADKRLTPEQKAVLSIAAIFGANVNVKAEKKQTYRD